VDQFDLVVIGGGPGGYVCAIRAAQLGLRVAVVEREKLGGTCLNWGCIPTKTMVAAVSLLEAVTRGGEFGLETSECRLDFQRLIAKRDAVISQLAKGIGFLFNKHKIRLIQGIGRLDGPCRVAVALAEGGSTVLAARRVVLAPGSQPLQLPGLPVDGRWVVTSRELLASDRVPESLLVVGGGVIGCEFAGIFAALGTRVTVVEALPVILPPVEPEVARRVQAVFRQKGIEVRTNTKVTGLRQVDSGIAAMLDTGTELVVEKVLVAVGRSFDTSQLGLAEAGVVTGPRGEIIVDDGMRTSMEGIYAVGDVTNRGLLAHVASAQGLVAAANAAGGQAVMDYRAVPNCIFTLPEVAGVGLTSQQAEAQGIKPRVGRFPFAANGRALCSGEGEGFVKVLAHPETDRLLGVHIIGPHASDLIAEAALAVRYGMTAGHVAAAIHAHPTLPEALAEAAEAVHGMAIHS